ncbi:FecR family protein [Pedobacter sp. JY14-1]|uniref:FecR family protein n=1 Tax=Pedobacter sp. JY14-1 TaxID=3034151 RepID=UPI0023E273FA|nr:FecR family protein [Pedobacter sp. JY14-1]
MKDQLPEAIFERYAQGKCTEEEQALVEAWYLEQLRQERPELSAKQLKETKRRIWAGLGQHRYRNAMPLFRWSAVAAAVVAAVLFVYLFQSVKQREEEGQHQVAEKAVTEAGRKAEQGTVLLASKVENSMMKLPDGSFVILEKGSKLTLLPAFNKKYNREVALEGKAFFDIAHNPLKPFIIYSGAVRTTVLGTAFDITAKPGSGVVKVNVIRGLVEVRSVKTHWSAVLPKNSQVIFDEQHMPLRKVVDASAELAWNQEDMEFNDISVADAKGRLESRFGYKIIVTDPALNAATFTYSMRSKEPMESFIAGLSSFIDGKYTIDHEHKTISIQPLNQ